jgi:hypothetical protein
MLFKQWQELVDEINELNLQIEDLNEGTSKTFSTSFTIKSSLMTEQENQLLFS